MAVILFFYICGLHYINGLHSEGAVHTSEVLALRRMRQENSEEFQTDLDYGEPKLA